MFYVFCHFSLYDLYQTFLLATNFYFNLYLAHFTIAKIWIPPIPSAIEFRITVVDL